MRPDTNPEWCWPIQNLKVFDDSTLETQTWTSTTNHPQALTLALKQIEGKLTLLVRTAQGEISVQLFELVHSPARGSNILGVDQHRLDLKIQIPQEDSSLTASFLEHRHFSSAVYVLDNYGFTIQYGATARPLPGPLAIPTLTEPSLASTWFSDSQRLPPSVSVTDFGPSLIDSPQSSQDLSFTSMLDTPPSMYSDDIAMTGLDMSQSPDLPLSNASARLNGFADHRLNLHASSAWRYSPYTSQHPIADRRWQISQPRRVNSDPRLSQLSTLPQQSPRSATTNRSWAPLSVPDEHTSSSPRKSPPDLGADIKKVDSLQIHSASSKRVAGGLLQDLYSRTQRLDGAHELNGVYEQGREPESSNSSHKQLPPRRELPFPPEQTGRSKGPVQVTDPASHNQHTLLFSEVFSQAAPMDGSQLPHDSPTPKDAADPPIQPKAKATTGKRAPAKQKARADAPIPPRSGAQLEISADQKTPADSAHLPERSETGPPRRPATKKKARVKASKPSSCSTGTAQPSAAPTTIAPANVKTKPSRAKQAIRESVQAEKDGGVDVSKPLRDSKGKFRRQNRAKSKGRQRASHSLGPLKQPNRKTGVAKSSHRVDAQKPSKTSKTRVQKPAATKRTSHARTSNPPKPSRQTSGKPATSRSAAPAKATESSEPSTQAPRTSAAAARSAPVSASKPLRDSKGRFLTAARGTPRAKPHRSKAAPRRPIAKTRGRVDTPKTPLRPQVTTQQRGAARKRARPVAKRPVLETGTISECEMTPQGRAMISTGGPNDQYNSRSQPVGHHLRTHVVPATPDETPNSRVNHGIAHSEMTEASRVVDGSTNMALPTIGEICQAVQVASQTLPPSFVHFPSNRTTEDSECLVLFPSDHFFRQMNEAAGSILDEYEAGLSETDDEQAWASDFVRRIDDSRRTFWSKHLGVQPVI